MRKIKYIINPVAGDGSSKETLAIIHEKMKETQLEYSISISGYKGDVENIAKEAVEEKYTDIVAVGGDGTLLEAFNGVFEKNVALGIIPTGTGNDFVKMLGIEKNIVSSIDRIIRGKTKLVDTGRVNDSHFLNVVGLGIDGEIVQKTEKVKKIIKGSAAYIYSTFSTLVNYQCKKIKIIIDDKIYEREVFLVAIGNGKYFGGGMKITPAAEIDNEIFEIVIINKMPKPKFAVLFRKVFSGNHVSEDVVETFSGKKVIVQGDDSMMINADGNIIGHGKCEMEILGKSQKFII